MFDELFKQSIPLTEASEFFVGLKKQAEWTDPPDMTGDLEGQFNVPVEQVLERLKAIITAKFRKVVAYEVYAQCFVGPSWRAGRDEFRTHVYDEQRGAEYYTKRAVALGGPVHMDHIEPPPATTNTFGILKIMARAEQEAIQAQRELRDMVGDANPMKVGIEEHMLKDQHHLDETWQLMTPEQRQEVELGDAMATAAQEQGIPQAAPEEAEGEELPAPEVEAGVPEEAPPAEGPPAQEKVASMRLGLAMHKLGFGETPGEMATPTADATQPTNYLAAEVQAQKAQEDNESAYYRQQLSQAQQEAAGMGQQVADTQARLDQLQQQVDTSSQQIEMATQEAMSARDDAVSATMETTKARIGAQRMRQGFLELASQDPQQLGEEAMAPQPQPGMEQPGMEPGMEPGAEAGPPPGPEGGAPPPGAAPPPGMEGMAPPPPPPGPGIPPNTGAKAGPPPGMPMEPPPPPAAKMASALLGAGIGAGLGAFTGATAGRAAPGLRSKVQQLEGQQGGFGHAAALAAAQKGLAGAELSQKHPGKSALMGGLTGAMTGAAAGAALPQAAQEFGGHARVIGGAMKRAVGG